MKETQVLPSTFSGFLGEIQVAAELTRKGYLVSLTVQGTEEIDILVTDKGLRKLVGVQVKTNQNESCVWVVSKQSERQHPSNSIFVFVNVNKSGCPDFFIVPSEVVSKFSAGYHKQWLAEPKKNGETRKDTSMRKFIDVEKKYLNRWDLLGL